MGINFSEKKAASIFRAQVFILEFFQVENFSFTFKNWRKP